MLVDTWPTYMSTTMSQPTMVSLQANFSCSGLNQISSTAMSSIQAQRIPFAFPLVVVESVHKVERSAGILMECYCCWKGLITISNNIFAYIK